MRNWPSSAEDLAQDSNLRPDLIALGEGGDLGILGCSDAIINVRNTIRKVGETSSTVLITGETGVGKELVAQAIHRLSARRNGPLVSLN